MFTHLHRSKQSLFYALLFYYYGHFNGETHQPKNPKKNITSKWENNLHVTECQEVETPSPNSWGWERWWIAQN